MYFLMLSPLFSKGLSLVLSSFKFLLIFPVCITCLHICVATPCVCLVPTEVREDTATRPGTIGSYELSCWCWELSPSPLQEQQLLCTAESPF